jgi:hypothetical protein
VRLLAIITSIVLLSASIAKAQTTMPASSDDTATTSRTDDADSTGDWGGRAERRANRAQRQAQRQENFATSEWSLSATATTYLVPHDRDYVQPTITADRDWLHLEARYNYEDLDTGSVFAGYNFGVGDKLTLEATPMIGAVFGNTNGVAPGYELSVAYKRFELYTEGEYLIDTDDSSASYFYTWSEFTYSPTDWLRAGVVIQRTKAYKTDLDVQRGLLVGFSYKRLDFTAYVLNLGWEAPTFVFSVGVRF